MITIHRVVWYMIYEWTKEIEMNFRECINNGFLTLDKSKRWLADSRSTFYFCLVLLSRVMCASLFLYLLFLSLFLSLFHCVNFLSFSFCSLNFHVPQWKTVAPWRYFVSSEELACFGNNKEKREMENCEKFGEIEVARRQARRTINASSLEWIFRMASTDLNLPFRLAIRRGHLPDHRKIIYVGHRRTTMSIRALMSTPNRRNNSFIPSGNFR